MSGLGRRKPTDWKHVTGFPLAAVPVAAIPRTPVVLGVNWYGNFDTPSLVGGRYWIGRGVLGTVRGGHCVCVKSGNYPDGGGWWRFYNQGAEGACVGFGVSRLMSLLNRRRYDARWLWDWAKQTDEWWDTNPGDDEGTSVRAALEILRTKGHVPWKDAYKGRDYVLRDTETPVLDQGVSAYRWATTVDEVRSVLQSPLNDQLDAVPVLNSWGESYPHIVWMPYTVLQRLLDEDGECGMVTDR